MRVLWLSNSPLAGSGYGGQTALFAPRIRDLGHEVAIAANHGIRHTNASWNGIPIYDASNYNSTVSTFARHWRADWVIALYDAWVMKPDVWDEDLKMALWAPIDHHPPPYRVIAVLMDKRVRPIAMSRFGEHWLKMGELDPLYVPHGVDTKVFRPIPGGREAGRAALKIPEDAFLIGMVAANRGWSTHACRKALPQAFDAFSHFCREHDDAYMYVHTHATPAPPGIDLVFMARAMGIPEDRLVMPDDVSWHLNLMDDQFVAGAMNAFDVLLNPSMSEGFGIPIVEAQACGVPVITSDHSSMPELTQSGWLVGGDRWWDGEQQAFAIMPSVSEIVNRLEEAYENRGNQKLRDDAVEFAHTYDADRVTELYWKPVLEALERPREVGPLNGNDSRKLNRDERRALAKRGIKDVTHVVSD